jgi:hypothetical protein
MLGGIEKLAPHDLRSNAEHVQGVAIPQGVVWNRSSFFMGMLRASPVGGNEIPSRVARDIISSNAVSGEFD